MLPCSPLPTKLVGIIAQQLRSASAQLEGNFANESYSSRQQKTKIFNRNAAERRRRQYPEKTCRIYLEVESNKEAPKGKKEGTLGMSLRTITAVYFLYTPLYSKNNTDNIADEWLTVKPDTSYKHYKKTLALDKNLLEKQGSKTLI